MCPSSAGRTVAVFGVRQLDESPFKRAVGFHIIEIEGESPFLEVLRRTVASAVETESRARAPPKSRLWEADRRGFALRRNRRPFRCRHSSRNGHPTTRRTRRWSFRCGRSGGTRIAPGSEAGHGSADVGALQPESPRRNLVFSEQIMQRGEAVEIVVLAFS